MRELSEQEKNFLRKTLPKQEQVEKTKEKSFSPKQSILGDRLGPVVNGFLSYLPLSIGLITVVFSSLATYLYIWGKDLFKVSELERMNLEGTLGFMDTTTQSWFEETLKIFSLAPWVILGCFIFGVTLMGISIVLIGKRRNG